VVGRVVVEVGDDGGRAEVDDGHGGGRVEVGDVEGHAVTVLRAAAAVVWCTAIIVGGSWHVNVVMTSRC
jgi:hypothetical protein